MRFIIKHFGMTNLLANARFQAKNEQNNKLAKPKQTFMKRKESYEIGYNRSRKNRKKFIG